MGSRTENKFDIVFNNLKNKIEIGPSIVIGFQILSEAD